MEARPAGFRRFSRFGVIQGPGAQRPASGAWTRPQAEEDADDGMRNSPQRSSTHTTSRLQPRRPWRRQQLLNGGGAGGAGAGGGARSGGGGGGAALRWTVPDVAIVQVVRVGLMRVGVAMVRVATVQ
eukprot:scaffold8166_cov102-Isochrysis_galbana.AAC.1